MDIFAGGSARVVALRVRRMLRASGWSRTVPCRAPCRRSPAQPPLKQARQTSSPAASSWRKESLMLICFHLNCNTDDARSVQVTTRTFGIPADGVTTPQQLNRKGAARTMSYMPSTRAKHYMWYGGSFAMIQRQYHVEDYGARRESLHIRYRSIAHGLNEQRLTLSQSSDS